MEYQRNTIPPDFKLACGALGGGIKWLLPPRKLTKRIFMHNNKNMLLAFSANLAPRKTRKRQAPLTPPTDEAIYKAKRAGKIVVDVAA